MQAGELWRLDKRLEGFLAKLTAGLGRSERRRWAGVYVRGLLLDGERKRIRESSPILRTRQLKRR